MTKGTIFAMIILTIILLVVVVFIVQGNNNTIYRNALGDAIYSVLMREGYIDPGQLSKTKFKQEVVKKVIEMGQKISTDEDIVYQSDIVLKELVEQEYHQMPIVQEYIMNLIKIEYHIQVGGKKAGKALMKAQGL